MKLRYKLLMLLILCGVAVVPLFTGPNPADFIVFRSPDERDSLRSILHDPGSSKTLSGLSPRYTLWSVSTAAASLEEEPEDPPGGAQPSRFLHHFDFGSRKGLSRQRYRLTFATAEVADGVFALVDTVARFVPAGAPPGRSPVLAEPGAIELLRVLFFEDLVLADIGDRQLVTMNISRLSGEREEPDRRVYRVTLTTRDGTQGDTSVLRYRVVFNPASRAVDTIERET